MRILVINNDGGGFADYVDVDNGTTVAQLFEKQVGAAKAVDNARAVEIDASRAFVLK